MKKNIGIVVEHKSSFKVIYKDGKRETDSISFKVIGPVQIMFSFKKVTFCSTVPIGDHFITIETISNTDTCFVRMKTDYDSSIVCVDLEKTVRSIRVIPETSYGVVSINIREDVYE